MRTGLNSGFSPVGGFGIGVEEFLNLDAGYVSETRSPGVKKNSSGFGWDQL